MPFLASLEKAHQAGNRRASLLLADNALTRAEDSNAMTEARSIYQTLAQRGDRDAQLKLAYLLEHGLGGKTNVEEAAHWYTLAANQNQPVAQYLLGRLNQMGQLDKQPDYTIAKQWYQKAMKQYAPAAIALGFINETVDNNYQAARRAYQVASEKNNAIGLFDTALVYEYGKGHAVDLDKAEALYLKAAAQHHVRAMTQFQAGIYLHDTGKFVMKK